MHDVPCLIGSNFNLHNPLSDRIRHFSSDDIAVCTPYYERAAYMVFSLLNMPGVYTRFPFVAGDRRSEEHTSELQSP